MGGAEERRKYIRHPLTAPIILSQQDNTHSANTMDISNGGLLFISKTGFPLDSIITISIPGVDKKDLITFEGRIVREHYNKKKDHYEIAVSFLGCTDILQVRMVEQVLRIENYRKKHNIKDYESAAMEWITNHSSSFPRPNSSGPITTHS